MDGGADLIETAAACGALEKNGSHFTFSGKSIGQGRDKARDTVLTDPALFKAVRKATFDALPSQAHRASKKSAA